ncbi:helix-turn-helix domain-containing protein [Alicyclobacillus ferrooxydans]|uniref:HTH cro/C1-type domain-containing protein n=1 Tax=Alicyclobacillus ferrooxydans TaxID=471514 RepID=A0A0P9CVN2_9BACL|nr:helix-turn-helix domain-containing protein [Alicyclobacillus ferrooxydans]KPV43782.1 hypothetical protein AN477_10365 [Alicyclobacillus ferrooxydans]
MTIRTWLRKLRISRGLTQDVVANHSYINRGFYSQIENGTRRPSPHVAYKIAKTLGCSPQLFWLDDMQDETENSDQSVNYTIFSHNDLDLRYTWLWSPYGDEDEYIGKSDHELYDDCVDLVEIKQNVIAQMTAVERVIQLRFNGQMHSYLAKSEPLLDLDGKLIGTHTAISRIQTVSTEQHVISPAEQGRVKGHVVYFYESLRRYLDYVVAFIIDSVTSGLDVWVVEDPNLQSSIRVELNRSIENTKLTLVHYVDSGLFHQSIDSDERAAMNEQMINLQEFFTGHRSPMRVWVHVHFKTDDMLSDHARLSPWENAVDEGLASHDSTVVCAYNAMETPASVQTAMLRHHKYFMTDLELVSSPLYKRGNSDPIFPTFARQIHTSHGGKNHTETFDE